MTVERASARGVTEPHHLRWPQQGVGCSLGPLTGVNSSWPRLSDPRERACITPGGRHLPPEASSAELGAHHQGYPLILEEELRDWRARSRGIQAFRLSWRVSRSLPCLACFTNQLRWRGLTTRRNSSRGCTRTSPSRPTASMPPPEVCLRLRASLLPHIVPPSQASGSAW